MIAHARKCDITTAIENGMWVIRAEVAGNLGDLVSCGSSGFVNPEGLAVCSARQMSKDLSIAEIDKDRAQFASRKTLVSPAGIDSKYSTVSLVGGLVRRGEMRRLIWSLAIAGSALAQRPAFEVASVKPSPAVPFGQNIKINLGAVEHNVLTLTNTTLCESLRFAYDLVSDDQVAGPAWIKDREFRYDVVAKGPANATREQLLEMLQTLLDERFKLAMHREPRVVAHYELVVAKRGLKIHPSKPEAQADVKYSRGHFSSQWMPMFRFTMLLSRQLRQAVIDKTGLTGPYDIDLD